MHTKYICWQLIKPDCCQSGFNDSANTTFLLLQTKLKVFDLKTFSKIPPCSDIPLPVFGKVTTRTAFYVKIQVTALPCGKGCADAVLEPGIVKAVADFYTTCTVCHGHVVTTAKLVQQVGFGIDHTFIADFLADVETDTAYSTFDTALIYVDTIAGSIAVAAKIAQSKLSLRLYIPAVLQAVFPAVLGTQRHACILKIAGDLIAVGIVNCKIVIHIADFEY